MNNGFLHRAPRPRSADRHGRPRWTAKTLAALVALCAFALLGACKKKDETPPPDTVSAPSSETLDGGAQGQPQQGAENDASGQSAGDGAQADASSDAAGEPAGTAQDGASDTSSAADPPIKQEVRSPSSEERAYNAAEVRAIQERLGLIPPRPLDVSDILRRTDVRQVTQFSGALTERPIGGSLPTRHHNGYRFVTPEGYGFAVEIWKYPSEKELDAAYTEYRNTLIAGSQVPRANAPTTVSVFAGIRQLVVKDSHRSAIVSVSCGEDQCTTQHLVELSSRVRQRL